jgi:hypothetical protein
MFAGDSSLGSESIDITEITIVSTVWIGSHRSLYHIIVRESDKNFFKDGRDNNEKYLASSYPKESSPGA